MVKNTILIPVSIDGQTFQFVFDTGGFLSISERIRTERSLAVVDSVEVSGVNGITKSFDRVLIPAINLGDLSFTDQKALVIYENSEYPEACFGADGMIGRDFFAGMIIQFDYQRGVLRITNNAANLEFKETESAKMRISERGIADIQLTLDGKKQFVEFDSGSGDLFSYKTKDARRLKKQSSQDKLIYRGIFSYGVSSKGNLESTIRYRPKVSSLKIANVSFTNFYSNFTKKTQPRIGAAILYHGKTTLDFQNLRFYFEPYAETVALPPYETFGFAIVYLRGKYLIKWVLDHSPAEELGLEYGLEVKTINGKPIVDLQDACDSYLNGFSYEQGDTVALGILDKSGEYQVLELNKIKL